MSVAEPAVPAAAGRRAELADPLVLPPDAVLGAGPLPPSQPKSFGSGPENETGMQLEYHRSGDVVHARLTLDERFAGRRGRAHGGVLAAILDDLLGAVLRVLGRPAVTAQLDVSYLLPVMTGRELLVEGWAVEIDGRKVHAAGRILDDGHTMTVARGLFVVVEDLD